MLIKYFPIHGNFDTPENRKREIHFNNLNAGRGGGSLSLFRTQSTPFEIINTENTLIHITNTRYVPSV
jgi:hypothetical protein